MEQANHQFLTAMKAGDAETVTRLLQRQPDLANAEDWTPPPLHCAVLWNQPEIAVVLLDHGADLEGLDPDRKTTPLRYAIMYAKVEMIPLLLRRGANQGAISDGGKTALELAEEAAGGAYEQYDDLPRATEYADVLCVLRECGVSQ